MNIWIEGVDVTCTRLPDLIQRHNDRYKRNHKDANSIKVVFIQHPQEDAEHLEYVEGVEDLQKDQGETRLK